MFEPAMATYIHRLPTNEYGEHPLVHHGFAVLDLLQHFFGSQPGDVSTAAVLHDFLEDGAMTREELERDFSEGVGHIVRSLTRRSAESYSDYIVRLSYNHDAAKIKVCDLIHNMRMDRLSELTDHTVARQRKYAKALDRLWGTLSRADVVE